jgi:hypothetical protein
MGEPNESVAELYRSEVAKLFTSYPPGDPARTALHDEIRRRFRELADWLAITVPPCPELWRAVQELHVGMMLSNAAVAANWRTLNIPPDSFSARKAPSPR